MRPLGLVKKLFDPCRSHFRDRPLPSAPMAHPPLSCACTLLQPVKISYSPLECLARFLVNFVDKCGPLLRECAGVHQPTTKHPRARNDFGHIVPERSVYYRITISRFIRGSCRCALKLLRRRHFCDRGRAHSLCFELSSRLKWGSIPPSERQRNSRLPQT